MKLSLVFVTSILCMAALPFSSAHSQIQHPSLILDSSRIAELQSITHATVPWEERTERERVGTLCYNSIVAAADYWDGRLDDPASWNPAQGQQFLALLTLSLAHLLREGEITYDGRYATTALGAMSYWKSQNYLMWYYGSDPPFSELPAGELLAGWSIAFDWLYDEMTLPQRNENVSALYYLISHINCRWDSSEERQSNHMGIGYGGLGLGCLALRGHLFLQQQEEFRQAALAEASERVRWYLDSGFLDGGAGIEGVFYSLYGLNVALPYALAADRFPGLSEENRVRVAEERYVQQAGTWLLYEQLPYDRFGGTPLNDTTLPPQDLHHPIWYSWPWLLAFPNPDRPTAAKHLFLATYPPAEWEADPLYFSKVPGQPYISHYHCPLSVLLAWPTGDVPSGSFIGPDDLRLTRAFPGRGLVIYRTEFHDLDALGNAVSNPDGTLITFESRKNSDTNYFKCHVHRDMNHFTVFSNGSPLFYDCGGNTWEAKYHNLHNIQYPDASWHGFWTDNQTWAPAEGSLVRNHLGVNGGPSFMTGDNTTAWNYPPYGIYYVDRSQRHLLILPRTTSPSPYLLFYDDFDYVDQWATKLRFFWHSANPYSDPSGAFDIDPINKSAVLVTEDAAAKTTFLSPASVSITQGESPTDLGPNHWRLIAETGALQYSDLVGLVELYPAASSPSLGVQRLLAPQGTLAYDIGDGVAHDLVGLRRSDQQGTWSLLANGHLLQTDGQIALLRFSSADREFSDIAAIILINGTRVWYDDQFVCGINVPMGKGSISGNSEEIIVSTDLGTPPSGYFVGPFIPGSAIVNGESVPVDMMDIPHPLTSAFPIRVGRSPNNTTVNEEYRYKAEILLRNGEGLPVVGWAVEDMSMDLVNCANPRTDQAPEGQSDEEGRVTWLNGLDSGGSSESSSYCVRFKIDYDGTGLRTFKTYPSITSPDEDGDMDVDEDDYDIWYAANEFGIPLYICDLNLNGESDAGDLSWMMAHWPAKAAEFRIESRSVVEEMILKNPYISGSAIQCRLAEPGAVSIDVYDVQGRHVRRLFDGVSQDGRIQVQWDGRDEQGHRVGAGIYMCRCEGKTSTMLRRIMLLR